MSLNLRKLQKDVISHMFQIASGDGQDDSKQQWQGSWKVLIYDQYCQEILAPIIHLHELRSMGITLHLLITNRRERVPDVPAVYFVRPTKENIDIICKDAANNLYDSMYLNFTSSIPRTLMEYLAQKQATQSVIRIQKVYDQYTEFVSLESNLVSLSHKNSYVRLNNPRQPEDKLFSYIDEIVESLFSVIVTMGTVPIIRCRAGEAAEMCASKLNTRLRDHLVSRNNLFANTNTNLMTFHRPVLILVDRNLDLSTPLCHSWTYQALVHDLLGMSSNRVEVQLDDDEKKKTKTSYDLNSVEDKFWKHNAGKPFTKVAENIQEKLKQYKADMDKMGLAGREMNDALLDDTKGLADALTKLPEMTKKKKYLDMHTNIATGVLKQVKAREIDTFFDLEQQCMNKVSLDPKALMTALGPESKGSHRDRERLLMIYYLCNNLTDAQLKELRDQLEKGLDTLSTPTMSATSTSTPSMDTQRKQQRQQIESDLAALDYLQQFKFVHRISSDVGAGMGQTKTAASGRFGDNISAWVGGFGGGLLAGVKNLLPVNTDLPLTKVVDALMKNQDTPETEKYHYFDPKVKSATGPIHKNRMTTPFKDAFVFVLGGGSYVEYQNLQDYAVKNSGPTGQLSIAYGSTEMVSPEGFLVQFAELGAADASSKRAAKAVPVD